MKGNPWTEDEIKTLKDNYRDKTSYELAEILNRTYDSIKHKARKLNISLRKKGEKCSWSKYSDEIVELARKMHDDGCKPSHISELLKIPYSNICDFVYYKRGIV